MAAAGADIDATAAPTVTEYLWPCCVDAWVAWRSVQTQWRVGGMGDRTGLDYAGVAAELTEGQGLQGDARREIWHLIKACEQTVLHEWADQREAERQRQPQKH